VGGQAAYRRRDGIPHGLGAMSGKSRPIFDRLARPVPLQTRQVQEHGEPGRAFDQRADRRAAETENEVSLPMTRDSPVADLRRAVADHQGIGDEGLTPAARRFSGQPEGAAGAQAGRKLSPQRAPRP